jgi:hypothetical protein
MRRYEKIAEENRRRQNEQKIDFIIDEPAKIVVTSETKDKERQAKT